MRAGDRIGSYEIIDELGRGGMAEVYRARDDGGNVVALKLLRQSGASSEDVRRFRREINLSRKLQHPNIVAVYDVGEQNGTSFIVMECMDGSLSDYLKQQKEGKVNLETAVTILAPLAAALDYAHAQGVVHRDIKPENILYQREDGVVLRWCLADFGIAKMSGDANLTRESRAIGTVAYIAPERLGKGTAAPGPAADQYSLGVVAYLMLTGKEPFAGTPEQVIMGHLYEPVPPPRSLNNRLPTALDRIILKMLAKQPKDRYQTVTAALEDLQAATGQLTDEVLRKMYERAQQLAASLDPSSIPAARQLLATIYEAVPTFVDRQRVATKLDEREKAHAENTAVLAPRKPVGPRQPLSPPAAEWQGDLYPRRKQELERDVVLPANSSGSGNIFAHNVRVGRKAALRGHIYALGDVTLEEEATVSGYIIAGGRVEVGSGCRIRSVHAASIGLGANCQVRRWAVSEGELAVGVGALVGAAFALAGATIEREAQVMSPSVVSPQGAIEVAPSVVVGEQSVDEENRFNLDAAGMLRVRGADEPPKVGGGSVLTSLLNQRLLRAITAAKRLLKSEVTAASLGAAGGGKQPALPSPADPPAPGSPASLVLEEQVSSNP